MARAAIIIDTASFVGAGGAAAHHVHSKQLGHGDGPQPAQDSAWEDEVS